MKKNWYNHNLQENGGYSVMAAQETVALLERSSSNKAVSNLLEPATPRLKFKPKRAGAVHFLSSNKSGPQPGYFCTRNLGKLENKNLTPCQ